VIQAKGHRSIARRSLELSLPCVRLMDKDDKPLTNLKSQTRE